MRTILQDLSDKAAKVEPSKADQVIARVYHDATNRGNIITRGEIVVPGGETLLAFPRTQNFPFHFRKTFTPASGPIQRGETPEKEFERTIPIHNSFPGQVPEPLGFDRWIYRCTAVCGQTLNALSPFADLKYENSLALNLGKSKISEHARIVISTCQLLGHLHRKGVTHGDLTLHNAMWEESGKPVLIDLAGSVMLSKLSSSKQRDAIGDDFSELFRELLLAQYYIGPLPDPYAQRSIELLDELIPDEIQPKFRRLLENTWTDEMS